jgi:hypothetical protein
MKKRFTTIKRGIRLLSGLMILLTFSTTCSEPTTTPDPVKYTTSAEVTGLCPDGLAVIEINASDGTPPYTYYVVPETQWSAGDKIQSMLLEHNFSRLHLYAYEENRITVNTGTGESPNYYWIAVQDAEESASISGTNLLSWWKRVKVNCIDPLVQ